MAAVKQSAQILAGYPVPNPTDAVDNIPITADYLVPSSGLGAGDIIEMGGMPEGCIFLGAKLACEDLDTGTTLTLDCGILSGTYGDALSTSRTMGNEFFAASTVGQTGGVQSETKAAALLIPPSLDVTPFGLKVVAAPTGNIVGARIRLTAFCRPAPVLV